MANLLARLRPSYMLEEDRWKFMYDKARRSHSGTFLGLFRYFRTKVPISKIPEDYHIAAVSPFPDWHTKV
jgi:hypothetical protein